MKIRNIKTKKEIEVSEEGFETIKKNPLTASIYVEVPKAKEPPEVKVLQEKQKTQTQKQTASSSEKADEGK